MAYRNKTYIAFDGDNDMQYYRVMTAWASNKFIDFDFYDVHELNYSHDWAQTESIKRQLHERLENSKLFILLIGNSTKRLTRFVEYEVETAMRMKLPIICVNLNGNRQMDSLSPDWFGEYFNRKRFWTNHMVTVSSANEKTQYKISINYKNDFKIKSALFCPYLSNLTYQYDPQKKKDNKILVGNSKWYIDSYIEIARILSRYSDLDITFLCAYGYDEKYEDKKQEIRELLKNNTVTFWEDKVSKEVYMMRLKSFSVYVCSVMRQTGLGACNASILSGSKLYLAGINLEHYRELGINVFNYKELANYTKSEEIFEYTDVIRNENFIQLQKTYCKEMFVKRYSEVFDRLLK